MRICKLLTVTYN